LYNVFHDLKLNSGEVTFKLSIIKFLEKLMNLI